MGEKNKNISITEEYSKIFDEIKQEEGLSVKSTLELLIDTYRKKTETKTVEVFKDNPEHLQKIKDLENELETTVSQLEVSTKEAHENIKDCKEREDIIKELNIKLKAIESEQVVKVAFSEFENRILDYALERFNNEQRRKEKEEATKSDFVRMYFRALFIDGDTLYGLGVSNSIIKASKEANHV